MFGLSVFVTVSLVGLVWFRSFQEDIYVLMNPDDGISKSFAVENTPVPSLFGFVKQAAGDIMGLVSGFLDKDNQQPAATNDQQPEKVNVESGKIYTLPLSERK